MLLIGSGSLYSFALGSSYLYSTWSQYGPSKLSVIKQHQGTNLNFVTFREYRRLFLGDKICELEIIQSISVSKFFVLGK